MSEQRLIDAKALGDKIMKMPFYTWKDCENVLFEILSAPTIDPVKHGKWMLKAYKEPSNYRWNVKAECSECCDEEKEIWVGFFPGVPDFNARCVAIQCAKEVKMSNYCPNCGARMDKE